MCTAKNTLPFPHVSHKAAQADRIEARVLALTALLNACFHNDRLDPSRSVKGGDVVATMPGQICMRRVNAERRPLSVAQGASRLRRRSTLESVSDDAGSSVFL